MAKQDRAIRTRRAILTAAAQVFDEHGYEAAKLSDVLERAQVSKGALYFHFENKEDLALAVLEAQVSHQAPAVSGTSKLQEAVDVGLAFAHRLSYDPLVRGSVRLTLDDTTTRLNRSGPYQEWIELNAAILRAAKEQGELLPHAVPEETAMVLVGAYAGINMMARSMNDQASLGVRAAALYRHVLPSIAVPGVLMTLDLSPTRGARVVAEAEEANRGEDE
ncbi:ScbR family autoregulator-binding transcription factor [Streptomyces fragilis]|uniref:ScbR family autoregulator-binding transcription factor n=1 Tax=Streptomyces fragilis TaxID=67301 RepID=A0ABV2YEZ1_9ACTN|nr:ScbR family autoregulator-binding transcription factor [Streptomyces fragilis]